MVNPSGNVTLRVQRFCWGVSSGGLTGLFNFLKDAMILIKAKPTTNDDDEYEDAAYENQTESAWWEIPLLIGAALVVCFTGLGILTVCMKRYDAIYCSSMFVGSLVVSASIMSAIHYDTFSHLHSAANWVLYPVGLIILMRGVYMLATLTSPTEHVLQNTTTRPQELLMVNKRSNVVRYGEV